MPQPTNPGQLPEDVISKNLPLYVYNPHIIWDPIWMEYSIGDLEPDVSSELAATRMQTYAAVYRAMSEGVTNAATVLKKSKT
jgi:hypothetical protein